MMKKLIASTVVAVMLLAGSFSTAFVGTADAASLTWSQKADKVIADAYSLQGKVHYRFANRNTSNPNYLLLDCSSFTQYVYKQAIGEYMPWSANRQHDAFPHVKKSDLRKGDLVFFSVGSVSKHIGHVGIYIGNGNFIHNVNPKSNVEVSNLNSGYWARHYVDASRPF